MDAGRVGRWLGLAAGLALGCACGPKINPGGPGTPAPDAGTANGGTGASGGNVTTYTGAAATIINASCASSGCHGGAQSPLLNSYATAKVGFSAPGQGLSQVNSGAMPLGKSLSAADKATLQAWAAGGYQQ